ncbi:VP5 [Green River chinook virus]|uniref:VP5 n=1 Tax=Green River chinook virus TaxID=1382300 RepID=W6EJ78_9REOV|nr:VP5 [Green River chinook virus]AHJ14805.1 VP5 [Green River chinook virus]
MVASASPAIDLKPGMLNPTGKAFVLSGSSAPSAENLILYVTEEGDYSYLGVNTSETLAKASLETNSWEPLFAITRTGCGHLELSNYSVTLSAYVGANPDDAFMHGEIIDGPFISSQSLRNFKLTLTNRLQSIADWNRDLDQAMSLLTSDLMAGNATCKWKSILEFLQSALPLDSLVLVYPNEFYTVAVSKYTALRPGTVSGEPPVASGPLGEIASVMNSSSSSVGLMVGSSATLTAAMDQVTSKNLDLISSDSPLPVSTFTPSLAPRDYRAAYIKGDDAHWISVINPTAIIRTTVELSARTYTIQIGPGPTKVLDMNRMLDSRLLLDVSGMPINILDNPDYGSAVPGIVLIEARVPYDEIQLASDIVAASVVAIGSLSVVNSIVSIRGNSTLEMLHLQALFERETIAGKPYVYGFGCLLMSSVTSASNFKNPTLMDGLLTITPILLRETTYKGEIVDEIIPADIMGNQTTEEMAVALANDAIVLMENNLTEIAHVVGNALPVASDTNDSATSAIVSRLAIMETMHLRERSHDPRALPDFGMLWKKAKRAASLFVSDPKSVLQAGIPVLASTGVVDAITSAVGTTVRTGNLGKGVQDALSILRARNSVTRLRQAFFKKIEDLWPVLDG